MKELLISPPLQSLREIVQHTLAKKSLLALSRGVRGRHRRSNGKKVVPDTAAVRQLTRFERSCLHERPPDPPFLSGQEQPLWLWLSRLKQVKGKWVFCKTVVRSRNTGPGIPVRRPEELGAIAADSPLVAAAERLDNRIATAKTRLRRAPPM